MVLPNLDDIRKRALDLGLEGEEAKKWVIEEHRLERDRKMREEIEERDIRAFKREEEKNRLEHIRKMEEMKASEGLTRKVEQGNTGRSGNKLPMFDGMGDNLEFFLIRFEDEARHKEWAKEHWGYELRKLMPHSLLQVCFAGSGKGVEATYEEVKVALSRHFGLTAQGYREKLAGVKPGKKESMIAYADRISHYLTRWVELSNTEKNYEKLFELTVVDKIIQTVSDEVVEHVLENGSLDLNSVIKTGEVYMAAHPTVTLTRESRPVTGNQRAQDWVEEGKPVTRNQRNRYQAEGGRRGENYQWGGTGNYMNRGNRR